MIILLYLQMNGGSVFCWIKFSVFRLRLAVTKAYVIFDNTIINASHYPVKY